MSDFLENKLCMKQSNSINLNKYFFFKTCKWEITHISFLFQVKQKSQISTGKGFER